MTTNQTADSTAKVKRNCDECQTPLPLRTVTITTQPCWKCHATIPVATGNKRGEPMAQDHFTQEELDFAAQHGVTLKTRYSFTAGGSYLGNICPQCDQLQGNYHLYTRTFFDQTPGRPARQSYGPCDPCNTRICPAHGDYQDHTGQEPVPNVPVRSRPAPVPGTPGRPVPNTRPLPPLMRRRQPPLPPHARPRITRTGHQPPQPKRQPKLHEEKNTMTNTAIPMSDTALRIMDADGEEAMWQFINSATRPEPSPAAEPLAAHLTDGSVIYLIDGNYTFQNNPITMESSDTRRTTPLTGQPPPAFRPVTPLFCWPCRQTLHQRVLEQLVDHAAEELRASGQQPWVPDPTDLFQQFPVSLPELLQGRRQQAVTLQPLSTDLIDHLDNYVDNLADQIVHSMQEDIRASLLHQITGAIARANEATTNEATTAA